MYFPKSQIKPNLKANPKEFVTVQGKEYVGDYFKTSRGEFFSGKSPSNPPNFQIYKVNKFDASKAEEKTVSSFYVRDGVKVGPAPLPPKPAPTLPTKKDYEVGQMVRYFVRKGNEPIFIEIQKSEYQKFIEGNPKVQFQLYTPFKLDWVIRGKKDEVEKLNKNITILKQGQERLFGLVKYFKNYCQYLVK